MGDKNIFCAYHAKCPFFNMNDSSELENMMKQLICLRAYSKCEIRMEYISGNKISEDAHPNKALADWLT
jgi:hypothetical protein